MKVTVVGDSVAWGQGLLETHKYGSIVTRTLGLATPPLMLAHSGATIGIRGATPFTAKSGEVSLQFWKESTDCLKSAVRDFGDARVSFADAGFTESNAVFATAPLLWGVRMDFSPQDEVIGDRHTACNVAYPLPLAVVEREACYRASAGHPNVAGAQQFAQAILASLAVV